MNKQFATVAVMAALCLALVGCGSDGPNLRPELEKLTEQVEKQTKQLEQVQDDFDTERDTQEELLEEQLKKAREETEEAERETEAERQRREAADRRAQQAQEQGQQEAQKREAGQRARGLLTALNAVFVNPDDNPDGNPDNNPAYWATPRDPANAEINDGETDIALTALPLTGSTRKSGNFYTATLSRTAPGVNQPERKIVVYTDREKSRSFASHYASFIASGVGGTTSNPRFNNPDWAPAESLDLLSSDAEKWISNPSRGGHLATIADAPIDEGIDKMVSSLSASVHGVSGRYGCHNSMSGAACKINVNAKYDTEMELDKLTITPEDEDDGDALYFDPGSGTISLLSVAKTGAPAVTDEEYTTFGWWRERPTLVDGTYLAAVFADVPISKTFAVADGTGNAVYEGKAVGLYVDHMFDGSQTVYESGDFTATAILRATFGNSDDGAGVEGDVTGFQTTHGARNWHVKLTKDSDGTAGAAEIVQAGTTNSEGTWEATFLARHENILATVDDQPIAVTGRFDASIPNVRHIVGAFGAHRTTGPVPE